MTDRDARPRCVAAVALDDRGRVLLIRHRTRGVEVPGGKCRRYESDHDALVREVREETGLVVAHVGDLLGVERADAYVCRVYPVVPWPGEPVAGDDALDAWWGEPREVADGTMPQDYVYVLMALDRRRRETA